MKFDLFGHAFTLAVVLASFLTAGTSPVVTAAGFQIFEAGVKGQGVAHAGMSTRADGPETVFFNPAGMLRLPGNQISFGLMEHFVDAEFTGRAQYSAAAGLLAGSGFENSTGSSDGGDLFLPAAGLYATYTISPDLKVGLGINTPFGLRTDYGESWPGRYLAIESELITVNFNPSFALKLNEKLSLGFGLDAVYANAKLSQALDLGLLLAPFGETPGALMNDGRATIDGDDWGFGFNFGIIYEPVPGTRLGLSYRSEIDLTINGTASFDTGRFPPATFGAAFNAGAAVADLKLPRWLSFGIYQEITPAWAVMVEATWTDWSVIDEIRIKFPDTTARPDTVLPTSWVDAWRLGLGIVHNPSRKWTLRAGVAYENTPTPDPTNYTPRVPAGDGVSVAVGTSYEWNRALVLDVAYTHIFVDALPIDRTEGFHRLVGEYEGSVDIIGAQLNYKMN